MSPSLAARNESGGDGGRSASADANVIPLRPGMVGGGDDSPTEPQVAAWWEQCYAQMGRTLTDGETADAHRITAAGFGLLIDGARASGVLSESQAAYLSGLAVEAVRAPDFLPHPK
ncbi:hypothetical protein ABT039_22400 [Streptomyces lasiicapitis]|uniref:hypothetical protein n=1 Tax=Streptomyces lasiicapitis TaxID=1923961 RepID=UPI00332A342F